MGTADGCGGMEYRPARRGYHLELCFLRLTGLAKEQSMVPHACLARLLCTIQTFSVIEREREGRQINVASRIIGVVEQTTPPMESDYISGRLSMVPLEKISNA